MVLRRYAVLAATRALRRIRPNAGSVLFLTKTLCVKHGQLVALSEASTLRFVAKHTSIPVPKVHSAFVHNGSTYILMDRIDGKMLTCGWSSRSGRVQDEDTHTVKANGGRGEITASALPAYQRREWWSRPISSFLICLAIQHYSRLSLLFTRLQTISQRTSG